MATSLILEGSRGFDHGEGEVRIQIETHERLRQVMNSRRAVSINHFQGWDKLPGETDIQSWLAAPLMRQHEVVGVIALGKHEESFYDQQAEQAVSAFANQVAVALVNASLFEETSARTERLSLLNRVSVCAGAVARYRKHHGNRAARDRAVCCESSGRAPTSSSAKPTPPASSSNIRAATSRRATSSICAAAPSSST